MGKRFSFSITELYEALRVMSDAPCYDFCNEFDVFFFVDFCDTPPDLFDPNKSKNLYLCNLCLKYIHRFLNYSFLDRKDTPNIVSKTVLYFM